MDDNHFFSLLLFIDSQKKYLFKNYRARVREYTNPIL